MRVAIFDYSVTPMNPAGSCHRYMISALCREHDFTVFAVDFDNPCPNRVKWIRIVAPKRPLALLFVAYHLIASIMFWYYKLFRGFHFDVVQMVESNFWFGEVSYVHFCHRAYLKYHWRGGSVTSLRSLLRYLDHWLHSLIEPFVFHKVNHIVVPSLGLKREIEHEYPFTKGKIHVIPNPVDTDAMAMADGFNRILFREKLGIESSNIVLVFVALGHFERKGLALILNGLQRISDPKLKLWVVGGESDLVSVWKRRAKSMGLAEQVIFFGMQSDIRPFLWAADAFVFPSSYEAFPLAAFQAAAAGLPLIVTRLYGVEEFMKDGETGFVVDPSVEGVVQGLYRFLALSPTQRESMGRAAQQAARRFDLRSFEQNWRRFLEEWKF